MATRKQRPGRFTASGGNKYRGALGSLLSGLTGADELTPVAPEDVPYSDSSFDANTQQRFKPAHPVLDALFNQGKAGDLASQTNIQQIIADKGAARQLATEKASTSILTDRAKQMAEIENQKILDLFQKKTPLEQADLLKRLQLGFTAGQGVYPNEENANTLNTLTTKPKLKEVFSNIEAADARNILDVDKTAVESKKLQASAPFDISTAGIQAQSGQKQAQENLSQFPATSAYGREKLATERQTLPMNTTAIELENLRRRMFLTGNGMTYFDISTGKPVFQGPKAAIDTQLMQQLKPTNISPSTGVSPRSTGVSAQEGTSPYLDSDGVWKINVGGRIIVLKQPPTGQ